MTTRAAITTVFLCILGGAALWLIFSGPADARRQESSEKPAAPSSRPTEPADLSAIEQPPDPDCEKLLEQSLSAIDAAARATESITLSTKPQAVGGSDEVDPEWLRIPRDQPFLRAFLDMPPGLPVGWFHRAPDLNPDDDYIPEDQREMIEVVLSQYRATLQTVGKRRDAARQADVAAAINSGAKATPLTGHFPHDPVSVPLAPENAGSAIVVRRDGDELTTTEIEASHLARYHYLNALYWFVAREFGCQVVAVYSALGYLPSGGAEVMTSEICNVCGKRSGS